MKLYILAFTIFFALSCKKKELELPAQNDLKNGLNVELLQQVAGPTGMIQQTADYYVKNLKELLDVLKVVKYGQVVYLADTAKINSATLVKSIYIPAGVTIESGYKFNVNTQTGNSSGAIFKTTTYQLSSLFRIMGDSVTIRGIRMFGPDSTIDKNLTKPIQCGIKAVNAHKNTIENCEISGWSYAGINFFNSLNNKVLSSSIKKNRRKGLGNGILLDSTSSVYVYASYFDNNRHAIAGSGHRTQSYEVSNCVLDMTEKYPYEFSIFDMHGECEMRKGTSFKGSSYASKMVNIHHNKIRYRGSAVIVIRGIPMNRSYIQYNTFSNRDIDEAIKQYLPKVCTGTSSHQFLKFPFNNIIVSGNYFL